MDKEKMEKKNNRTFSLCVALGLFLGFLIGLVSGINYMKSECDKWSDMYDRHINDQWNMMQRKDSMYAEYFKLLIEYMDGHTLEPEK